MGQTFNTIRFEDQLSILESCNEWMKSKIGIKVDNTRFENTLNILQIIVEHYKQDSVEDLMKGYDEATLFYVLTDASSFIKIFEFFRDKKSHEIPRRKLIECISGPILPWNEEPDKGTAHGRNITFEIETAISYHKAGLFIESYDDVQFQFDNCNFNVQCKKVHSLNRVADNIQAAVNQITDRIADKRNHKGIICLCIEKLTETEGWILEVDHVNDIGPHLDKLTHDFIHKYSYIWQRLVNINILGTAIVINALARINEKPLPLLTTCRHTMLDIIPNKGTGQDYDYFLIKNLAKQLGATKMITS